MDKKQLFQDLYRKATDPNIPTEQRAVFYNQLKHLMDTSSEPLPESNSSFHGLENALYKNAVDSGVIRSKEELHEKNNPSSGFDRLDLLNTKAKHPEQSDEYYRDMPMKDLMPRSQEDASEDIKMMGDRRWKKMKALLGEE